MAKFDQSLLAHIFTFRWQRSLTPVEVVRLWRNKSGVSTISLEMLHYIRCVTASTTQKAKTKMSPRPFGYLWLVRLNWHVCLYWNIYAVNIRCWLCNIVCMATKSPVSLHLSQFVLSKHWQFTGRGGVEWPTLQQRLLMSHTQSV
jgi:hypothetical protein